jgi:hypothetical protein
MLLITEKIAGLCISLHSPDRCDGSLWDVLLKDLPDLREEVAAAVAAGLPAAVRETATFMQSMIEEDEDNSESKRAQQRDSAGTGSSAVQEHASTLVVPNVSHR